MPVTRLAQMFPNEVSPSLSREAILQQLQGSAEMIAALDPIALDEQVTALVEDLRQRVQRLLLG